LSGMSIYQENIDMRGKKHEEVEDDGTSCIVAMFHEYTLAY